MGLFNTSNNIEIALNKLIKQNQQSLYFSSQIAENLDAICQELHSMRFTLSSPGQLNIILKEKIMDVIKFKVILPTLTDLDVANRELTVQVADAAPLVQTVTKDTVEVDGYEGNQDAAVVLSLVDIDDSGNRSEASTLNVVLTDIFPPAKPGELGIVQTGETVSE